MFHKGYKLALDDFIYSKPWAPFIKICRLIKFDIMATPLDTIGLLVNKLKQNKPSELTQLSIIRARFCELIAKKVSSGMSHNAFMMGQFSLIDAILDKSMEDALIGKSNILFHVLEVEKSYEKASWWAMKLFS